MTLAIIDSAINQNWLVSQVTRDDIFAIADGDDMHFNGLTKTNRGYEPNDRFSWDDYYALDGDSGIGVRRIRPSQWEIVLLCNGTEKVSVNCDLASLYAFPEKLSNYRRSSESLPLVCWPQPDKMPSHWSEIKRRLSLMAHNNSGAKEIWDAMENWEQTSLRTCDWLKKKMNIQKNQQSEVLVAGEQWLWHNWYKDAVIIGKGQRVWGKTKLRSRFGPFFFSRASPIRHGWLIELTHDERYLLRWTGTSVLAQSVFFPYGKWEKSSGWILWPRDAVAFAPDQRVIFAPPDYIMVGASTQHVFSVWDRNQYGFLEANEVIMTDLFGEETKEPLPVGDSNEKTKRICIGSQSMLFVTCYKDAHVLYIVDLSFPVFRLVTRSVLFQKDGDCVVYAIKSNPDVYAVIYQVFGVTPVRIFLIDTEKRVSFVPYVHHCSSFFEDVFRTMMPQDNHLLVEMVDEKGNLTGQTLKIGMENEMGYACFSDGITTRYEATKLGCEFMALSNYLSQYNSGT